MNAEATRQADECKRLLTRAMTAQADARELGDYAASKQAHTEVCAAIDKLAAMSAPTLQETPNVQDR